MRRDSGMQPERPDRSGRSRENLYTERRERSGRSRENLYTERRRAEQTQSGRTASAQRAPRKRGSEAERTVQPEQRVRTDRTRRPETQRYREEKQYYQKSLTERSYYGDRRPAGGAPGRTQAAGSAAGKKKKSKAKRVLTGILVAILVLVVAAGVIFAVPSLRNPVLKAVLRSPLGPVAGNMFFGANYEKYVRDKDFDESKIRIHDGVKTPAGNMSIALFGVDARTERLGEGTMADSMIVVNADDEGHLRMASVFRDTYLMSRTKENEEIISKANSAYFRGGPQGALNMLNENFDLALTDYVVVNFFGLSGIVDKIGGLTLTISEEEKDELNFHMSELARCFGTIENVPLEKAGKKVKLTGDQVTAFCRIRKKTFHSPLDGETYHDDYGRTARQRYVLKELLSQLRAKGILSLMSMADEIFASNSGDKKFIQTSLTMSELVRFFALGSDMDIEKSAGFPDLDHQYNAMLDSGDTVVADQLEDAVTGIHSFLYDTENYEPTPQLSEVADKIRAEVFRQIGR